jgi:hypothetical protein
MQQHWVVIDGTKTKNLVVSDGVAGFVLVV